MINNNFLRFSFYSLRSETDRFLPVVADMFMGVLSKSQALDLVLAMVLPGTKLEHLQHLQDYDRALFALLHLTVRAMTTVPRATEKTREALEFVHNTALPKLAEAKHPELVLYLNALVLSAVTPNESTRQL